MAGIQVDGANQKVVLDSDGDTYLEAATDDTIKVYVAGAHDATISANAINVLSGTTLTIDSGATITNSGTANGFSSADPASADGDSLGTASLEWSDLFLADGGIIKFGNDQDVLLTHVADTGLLLNGTNVIQFNDASQNIGAPSNAILDINATDEIELNATAIDLNGTLDVSGTLTVAGATTQTGLLTVAAGINFPDTMSEQADVNTLDDYEEGNWTPVYFGLGGTTAPTYSVQSGKYTKVGRSVTLTGTLTITAHDATGNMNLSGFPFTVGGSSDAGYYAAWDFFMGDTGWQSLPAADYSGYPGVNVDRGPMHYVASGEGHGQTYFVIQTHCAGDATCALHFRLNYFTD